MGKELQKLKRENNYNEISKLKHRLDHLTARFMRIDEKAGKSIAHYQSAQIVIEDLWEWFDDWLQEWSTSLVHRVNQLSTPTKTVMHPSKRTNNQNESSGSQYRQLSLGQVATLRSVSDKKMPNLEFSERFDSDDCEKEARSRESFEMQKQVNRFRPKPFLALDPVLTPRPMTKQKSKVDYSAGDVVGTGSVKSVTRLDFQTVAVGSNAEGLDVRYDKKASSKLKDAVTRSQPQSDLAKENQAIGYYGDPPPYDKNTSEEILQEEQTRRGNCLPEKAAKSFSWKELNDARIWRTVTRKKSRSIRNE
jgi:hypothetical protein